MQQSAGAPAPAMDISPESLRVLVVESNPSSRASIVQLLKECSYQVMDVKGTAEALQLLKEQQARDGAPGVDLILKEHNPPAANACRLLARTLEDDVLRTVPVVVTSPQEDREVMVACLQLGAADYMIKPLRHNELRNLWARVYWWRRVFYLQQQATRVRGAKEDSPESLKLRYYPDQSQHSSENLEMQQEDQKQGDKDETERSGEGSAPNSGADGNEGSKECNRNSKSREKLGSGSGNNGNGNSATKQCQGSNQPNNESGNNGNGNSHTKAGNVGNGNGNSGNDASTTFKEAAALRGTAEGGKRHAVADENTKVADAMRPPAALDHVLDVMRSRSASLKLEHVPVSNSGSGQDSKQNRPISSVEPNGSSGQETARLQGTTGNLTGEDGALLLKAANLQNTVDGADLTAALDPRPSHDASGFRAYVQSVKNNKRKASEVGNLVSAPPAKQANHPMARAGSLAGPQRDGAFSAGTAWCMTSGCTPTSASEDTRIPASGGSAVQNRAVSNNPTDQQGDWQVANMAAHMQARMQHQQQQGNSQQMPNPQLGPFGGPGSFPFYGMPGPNFPMSNPFWPQMGSGMPGGNQGPRPPLYPGGGNNGQFDPVSAAYYANLSNQQMAAAMAAAANASGASSVTGKKNSQQQQQFANFMLQQQQQQHQMLMQQYSMAAAAQQLGQWCVNSNRAAPSSPRNRQGFPYAPFGSQSGSRARSFQSFPAHALPPQQFAQQQAAAAAQKGPEAVRQHQQNQQGSLHVHSAPANGANTNSAPTRTATGATSRAPPMPQQNGNGAPAVAQQAMRMQQQTQQAMQQQQQQQQQPGQQRPAYQVEAADGKSPGGPEEAAAAGKERRAQALHKYKQKRKNLNFTKQIRYESRKQLAQARPRVKGQFVRMTPSGPELTAADSDAQGEILALLTGGAMGSAEAVMALAAGNQAEEDAPNQEEESDQEVVAKPEAADNGPWQGAVKPLDDYDEDDAVTSPQDNFPCPAPVNHSMSRLQQQSLPAHQLIAQQAPIGKNGSGTSNSGSSSPEIYAQAPTEQTAPPAITV